MSKIGFNIEGGDLGSRRDIIKRELTSYRANWHLCLGDLDMAYALKEAGSNVIYRVFDPFGEHGRNPTFDNTFWLYHSPEMIITWLQGTHGDHLPHFVWSVGNNEPSTRGKTEDFVDWCVRLMDLGAAAGIRFAIAEIAVAKSIEVDEVQAGIWDRLIKKLDEYRDFGHIFTVHEYTTGLLPAQAIAGYPLNLDEPNVVHWRKWQEATLNMGGYSGNYHIGRGLFVSRLRAQALGIKPLPFVVTEGSFDWMADIVSTLEREQEIYGIKTAFDMPHHDELRGSTGHKLYHEWIMRETVYPGDWNDFLFDQYKWLLDAYPVECEGVCIFALNNDWDIPEGHDMAQPRNDKFRQLVINNPVGVEPMQDVWQPEMVERMVSVTHGWWNMRGAMSTSASVEVLGTLTTEPRKMLVSKTTNPGNGLNWYKFIEGDTSGYFADDEKLRLEPVADTPPVEPEPEPEPPTPEPTPDIEALKEALMADITALLSERVVVDVPIPAFTMSVPKLMRQTMVQHYRALAAMYSAMADRIEAGTPTLSQIASAGYSTLATDEDVTITDVILNGDSEAA